MAELDGTQLQPAAAAVLPEIVARLVRQFQPERIILFGSQARGDARPDSDIDLLVVLSHVEHKRESMIAMLSALRDLLIPVDVIVTTPEVIARRGQLIGSVLRPALREGRVVYERR
jgi:predicted nucleotidyltransferase